MAILHSTAIKEIAKEIALGNTCYVNKSTSKITTIDLSTEDTKVIAAQELEQAECERKIENYVKLEKLTTQNLLLIMEYFLDELPDKSVRKQISNALKRKNPVRNFIQAVESDMDLHQHWRNFRVEEYQRYVSNFIIDAYNY